MNNDLVDRLAANRDITPADLKAAAAEIQHLRAELAEATANEQAAIRRLSATQNELLKLRMSIDTDD